MLYKKVLLCAAVAVLELIFSDDYKKNPLMQFERTLRHFYYTFLILDMKLLL